MFRGGTFPSPVCNVLWLQAARAKQRGAFAVYTTSAGQSSKWVCKDAETFRQRANECLQSMERVYDLWLPHRWKGRGLPSHVVENWVAKERHSSYHLAYRIAFGCSLLQAKSNFQSAFSGYIRRPDVVDGAPQELALDFASLSPLDEFGLLVDSNRSLCDVAMLHQLLGFCHTRQEVISGLESLLLTTLAHAYGVNTVAAASEVDASVTNSLVSAESAVHYQLIYAGQDQKSPKLFRWAGADRPGGEWMLLQVEEDGRPRVTVLLVAHPNKYLRAYQLPLDDFPAIFSLTRQQLQLDTNAKIRMSFIACPPNHVDHQSLFQVKQMLRCLPPSVEPWVQDLLLPFERNDLSLVSPSHTPMWDVGLKAEVETQVLFHVKRKTEYPVWLRPLKVK